MKGHQQTKVLKSRSVGFSEVEGKLLPVEQPTQDVHNVLAQSPMPDPLATKTKTNAELQQAVNDAVTKAGDLPQKSKKQIDKEADEEKRYWNTMISREECRTMILSATQHMDEKLRMLFISTSTLMNFVIQRGLATTEELDVISRPIVQQMYGMTEEEYNTNLMSQKARQQAENERNKTTLSDQMLAENSVEELNRMSGEVDPSTTMEDYVEAMKELSILEQPVSITTKEIAD